MADLALAADVMHRPRNSVASSSTISPAHTADSAEMFRALIAPMRQADRGTASSVASTGIGNGGVSTAASLWMASSCTTEVSCSQQTTTAAASGNSFTARVTGSDAGFNSSYGYYVTDDAGNPVSGKVLFADVKDGGVASVLGVDPSHVGFFIIPNGGLNNPDLADGEDISFKQVDGRWTAFDSSGQALSGCGADVLFDNKALNGDGVDHARNGVGGQGWEDLCGGGDADYNDVSIDLSWGQGGVTTTTTTSITVIRRTEMVMIGAWTDTIVDNPVDANSSAADEGDTASSGETSAEAEAEVDVPSKPFGEAHHHLDPEQALEDAAPKHNTRRHGWG